MSHDNPFEAGRAGQSPSHEAVPLELGPILSRAWELFSANPGLVIGGFLLMIAPNIVFGVLNGVIQGVMGALAEGDDTVILVATGISLLVNLFSTAVVVFLQLGLFRMLLHVVRGEQAEIGMLLSQGAIFLPAIGASIVVGIGVTVGLVLLIVPGIILSIALQYFLYLMVDRGAGAIESLSQSWTLTQPHLLTLFLFNIAFFVMAMTATCLTCGLGMIVAGPVLMLAQAIIYDTLLSQNPAFAAEPV